MIVLVPIALGAPAVLVFVPPLMALTPATLPRRVQFTAFMVSLGAVPSMFLNCFVKIMLSASDPALAAVVGFGVKRGDCCEKQSSRQHSS